MNSYVSKRKTLKSKNQYGIIKICTIINENTVIQELKYDTF